MPKQPTVQAHDRQTRTIRAKAETFWIDLADLREVVRLAEGLPDKAMVTTVISELSATYVGERLIRQLIVRADLQS